MRTNTQKSTVFSLFNGHLDVVGDFYICEHVHATFPRSNYSSFFFKCVTFLVRANTFFLSECKIHLSGTHKQNIQVRQCGACEDTLTPFKVT